MSDGVSVPLPPVIIDLIQKGLLERAFSDPLMPNLVHRQEAVREEHKGNSGEEVYVTKMGRLGSITTPLKPGVDPEPRANTYEQYRVFIQPFGDAIDTNMPTSTVAMGNLFLNNIKALGTGAGETVNRLVRNALYKAYSSGYTELIDPAINTDTQIHVASLNGFTDVLNISSHAAPQTVSTRTPLQISIVSGATSITRYVIGYSADDPNDLSGPGVLLLSAVVGGSGMAARAAVVSVQAPRIIFCGGGNSVDAITSGDLLTMQDVFNAVAQLRDMNVPTHEDGFYHAYLSSIGQAQVFADPVYQRLNQSLPDGDRMRTGFIGTFSQTKFFLTSETPNELNTGARTATGSYAYYSTDIGTETTNENGVNLDRVIVTGQGAIYERYLDEGAYVTEAGVTGKVGEFNVRNNGVDIDTEGVRLVIRAPMDRLMQKVSAAWSATLGFPIPTDITGQQGQMRYRRAIEIVHAR